jgi:serine/threonine-protein kinase
VASMSVSNSRKLASLEYRVVKALGAGAGSTILLVLDSHTGTRYALKVVKRQSADDDIYVNQATHEYEVAQRLSHPNLLRIYDCRVKRRWFRVDSVELLMEYVEGRNLDELQVKNLGQIVLMFIQVASALSHMHRRGVFHGDVKPGNILLSRAGQVKLIDFGTAWIKGEPKNRVQGTIQYMAPEQVHERTVDDRTDIYNFGATLYRIVTGHYANLDIPGMTIGSLARRGRTTPMKLRPEVPGALNEAIMACIAEDPAQRPAGFSEIKDQLVAVARYLDLDEHDMKGSEETMDH